MCHYDTQTSMDQECGQSDCHFQMAHWLQRYNVSEITAPCTGVHESHVYTSDISNSFFPDAQTPQASFPQPQGGLHIPTTYYGQYESVVPQKYPTDVDYFNHSHETISPTMMEEEMPQPWSLAQDSNVFEPPQHDQARPKVSHSTGPRRPRLAPPVQPKVKDHHKFIPTKEMTVPEGKIFSIGEEHFCSDESCEASQPYTSKQSATEHWLSAHGGVRWKCLGCDREFGTTSGARRHFRSSHQGTKFPCPCCRKPQSSRSNLARHLQKCKGPR